jgi:Zn-dependent peptidase ImmA (M78 family)
VERRSVGVARGRQGAKGEAAIQPGDELAHVIWHPLSAQVLPDTTRRSATERIEAACEYFAACLLMPRIWMKRAYFDNGFQDVPSLARLFGVSCLAMRVRLEQLGFVAAAEREDGKEAA